VLQERVPPAAAATTATGSGSIASTSPGSKDPSTMRA